MRLECGDNGGRYFLTSNSPLNQAESLPIDGGSPGNVFVSRAQRPNFLPFCIEHDAFCRKLPPICSDVGARSVEFPPNCSDVDARRVEFPPNCSDVGARRVEFPPICSDFDAPNDDRPPNCSEFWIDSEVAEAVISTHDRRCSRFLAFSRVIFSQCIDIVFGSRERNEHRSGGGLCGVGESVAMVDLSNAGEGRGADGELGGGAVEA